MIFGMLDFNFSFMDFTIFDDFFTEYVFSWGSRTSAPSWRARRHGLRNAIFLLTGLLMRFQPNCMAWTFEYVATYANACSLLQPCEPLCWSWTCRPAVLGEEKGELCDAANPCSTLQQWRAFAPVTQLCLERRLCFLFDSQVGCLCFAFGAC